MRRALDDITQKDLVREGLENSFMIHVMCYKMQGNHVVCNDCHLAQLVGLSHGGKAGFREFCRSNEFLSFFIFRVRIVVRVRF